MLFSLAARLSAILLVPGFHAAAAEPLTSVEKAIPFDQLGTEADKSGAASNTRSITPTKDGAKLDAMMQDLRAEATQEGLWLTSVADEDVTAPNRFRVRAVAVGRDEAGVRPFLRLSSTGRVQATEAMASWMRPGLIEEYTVSTMACGRISWCWSGRRASLGIKAGWWWNWKSPMPGRKQRAMGRS